MLITLMDILVFVNLYPMCTCACRNTSLLMDNIVMSHGVYFTIIIIIIIIIIICSNAIKTVPTQNSTV